MVGQRGRDRVRVVYSRSEERGAAFRGRWGIAESTTDMAAAINHPDTDVVVVALPNHLHEEAVTAVARAGKAVLCTKPLGRNAAEARRMLDEAGFPVVGLDVDPKKIEALSRGESYIKHIGAERVARAVKDLRNRPAATTSANARAIPATTASSVRTAAFTRAPRFKGRAVAGAPKAGLPHGAVALPDGRIIGIHSAISTALAALASARWPLPLEAPVKALTCRPAE